MNKLIIKDPVKRNIKLTLSASALTVLTILEIAAFFAAIIAFIYSFVLVAAWHSAMAFCLLFGACWIFIGIGLFCVYVFCIQLKFFKYRYVASSRYFQNRDLISTDKNGKLAVVPQTASTNQFASKNAETAVNDAVFGTLSPYSSGNASSKATSSNRRVLLKKIFTISNVACMMIVLGALFTVVSAIEKSTTRSAWATARYDYMYENGYYVSTKIFNTAFPVKIEKKDLTANDNDVTPIITEEITKLKIDLNNKNAVVIYTDKSNQFVGIHDETLIQIHSFITYINQLSAVVSGDGSELTIRENATKLLNRPSEKMLFFLFNENEAEKQIKIYIPNTLKDKIAITGEYVIAK